MLRLKRTNQPRKANGEFLESKTSSGNQENPGVGRKQNPDQEWKDGTTHHQSPAAERTVG